MRSVFIEQGQAGKAAAAAAISVSESDRQVTCLLCNITESLLHVD